MAECGCGDKTCSDCKECVDCECQLKPGNTCVSDLDCPRCYDCVNCNCQNRCTSDQCCNESTATCVDKCTNTGECDWGEFLHAPYAECLNMDPFIKSCAPGVEGALCKHRIIYYATDAECAPCAPGCSKTRVDHCAEITPGYCRTHCILMVCNCSCDLKPEEAWRQGDHYTCGE